MSPCGCHWDPHSSTYNSQFTQNTLEERHTCIFLSQVIKPLARFRNTLIHFQATMLALLWRWTEAGSATLIPHSPVFIRAVNTLIVICFTDLSSRTSRECVESIFRVFIKDASMLAEVPPTGISGSFTGQSLVPRRTLAYEAPSSQDTQISGDFLSGFWRNKGLLDLHILYPNYCLYISNRVVMCVELFC